MESKFKRGQKVWCYYHFTILFKPPMCGEILFKLPYKRKHHFAFPSDYPDRKCYWYFVLMKNGLIVLMPELCINDLKDKIKEHDKDNKCPSDTKQLDSWMTLNKWQADRARYSNA